MFAYRVFEPTLERVANSIDPKPPRGNRLGMCHAAGRLRWKETEKRYDSQRAKFIHSLSCGVVTALCTSGNIIGLTTRK